VRVDGTDVHRWPVSEIAPLMLGPAGSSVTLGFLRRIPAANESGQVVDDLSLNGSMKSKVPKLWKQGDTPRNEAARSDDCAHFVVFYIFPMTLVWSFSTCSDGKGEQFRLYQVTLTRGPAACEFWRCLFHRRCTSLALFFPFKSTIQPFCSLVAACDMSGEVRDQLETCAFFLSSSPFHPFR
jgi:hypothetical protein